VCSGKIQSASLARLSEIWVVMLNSTTRSGRDPWVGTLDTGLIYQVTPNFSIAVDAFFGLTHSAPDYNVFSGFGYRF
jgi:hypothetical protein